MRRANPEGCTGGAKNDHQSDFDEVREVDRVELLQSSANVLRLPKVPRQKGRGTLGFDSATPSA